MVSLLIDPTKTLPFATSGMLYFAATSSVSRVPPVHCYKALLQDLSRRKLEARQARNFLFSVPSIRCHSRSDLPKEPLCRQGNYTFPAFAKRGMLIEVRSSSGTLPREC